MGKTDADHFKTAWPGTRHVCGVGLDAGMQKGLGKLVDFHCVETGRFNEYPDKSELVTRTVDCQCCCNSYLYINIVFLVKKVVTLQCNISAYSALV